MLKLILIGSLLVAVTVLVHSLGTAFWVRHLNHIELGALAVLEQHVDDLVAPLLFPGRVFEGRVRGMGFGVDVDKAALGSLPTIRNNRDWLRDAQRFPVDVEFELGPEESRKLRVGAQASVIIYTADRGVMNVLGRLQVRIASLMSYAY